jgi:hypothetical protein
MQPYHVLNPGKGFEIARKGTNGFHTFVARTGDDTFRGSWPFTEYRNDILYPVSFDSAGVKAQMRVFFDTAQLIQLMGLMERAAIVKQYQETLGRPCSIKKAWCLPESNGPCY